MKFHVMRDLEIDFDSGLSVLSKSFFNIKFHVEVERTAGLSWGRHDQQAVHAAQCLTFKPDSAGPESFAFRLHPY